jgi:glycerophosphoryl diester phosphodiesterase
VATENTAAAFERAFDEGAGGIELDVRLSRDGKVLVFHDETLARLAGREEFVCDVGATELRRIELGGGGRIPTLDEALDVIAARNGIVNVEVKGVKRQEERYFEREEIAYRVALARAVTGILGRRSAVDGQRVLLSTFDPLVLAWLRALCRTPAAFLFDRAHTGERRARWVIRTLRPECLHPEAALATERTVAGWRGRAAVINAWTVNDVDRAVELSRAGVDGIITDRPADVARALASAPR